MKKRSQRLDKIVGLHCGLEQLASRSLALAQRQYEQQKSQFDRLLVYRREYQTGLGASLNGKLSLQEVNNYRNFLASLEIAIERQGAVLNQCQLDLDLARTRWMEKRQDVQKVEKVMNKVRGQELAALERRERSEIDERNQLSGKAVGSP